MDDKQREADRKHEDDLTSGPTPLIRRAEGHDEDGTEVTKGPTPEIREAEERSK
jgi:hypothetical protein